MTKRAVRGILLDEQVQYSLEEICEVCSIQTDWVAELVELGIIEPTGRERRQWRFPGSSLHTAIKARRLQRDLNLNLSGVALAIELLEEIDQLRSRLKAIDTGDY